MGRGRKDRIIAAGLAVFLGMAFSGAALPEAAFSETVLSESVLSGNTLLGSSLSLPVGTAWAAEEGTVLEQEGQRIEQVYVNLPEAVMYGSGISQESVSGAEAYLSQDKLSLVKTGVFSELDEGIYYYVLLDISGSMPDRYFTKVKEGIQNLQDSLGEKDRLILCTFGEKVTLAADGSQTAEGMADILSGLDNGDQKTLLFEGIDQAASLGFRWRRAQCRR